MRLLIHRVKHLTGRGSDRRAKQNRSAVDFREGYPALTVRPFEGHRQAPPPGAMQAPRAAEALAVGNDPRACLAPPRSDAPQLRSNMIRSTTGRSSGSRSLDRSRPPGTTGAVKVVTETSCRPQRQCTPRLHNAISVRAADFAAAPASSVPAITGDAIGPLPPVSERSSLARAASAGAPWPRSHRIRCPRKARAR